MGGGPAGSTTALFAAKAGLKTMVFDTKTFPRDKACGGLVSPFFFDKYPWLRQLPNEISVTHHFGAWGYLEQTNFKAWLPIRSISFRRREFDAFLLRKAQTEGSVIKEDTRITDMVVKANEVELRDQHNQKYSARVVIGADGINSLIAQRSGLRSRWLPSQIGVCVEGEYPSPKAVIEELYGKNHCMHVFPLFLGAPGYGWVFPKETVINIGVGGLVTRIHHPRQLFLKFLKHLMQQKLIPKTLDITRPPLSWTVPLAGPIPKTQTNRVLLVGDAAGLVNPLTGGGIENALLCSQLAVKTITNLHGEEPTAQQLDYYQTAWEHQMGARLRRDVIIQSWFTSAPGMAWTKVMSQAPIVSSAIKTLLCHVSSI